MRKQAWRSYLAVMAVVIAGYPFTPFGSWTQIGWQLAIGYGATAALVYGARRNLPGERAIWWCFAVGVFGNTSGILVEQLITLATHGEGAFPSAADGFYLSLYPAVALGLWYLIRKRTAHRDWGTLVDGTTISAGLGLLAWIFMIRPAASDTSIGLLGHVVSVAYPVGDIVLVAMTVRLQLGLGSRTPSLWFMISSLLAFLGGDTEWAAVNQVDWTPNAFAQNLLKMTFLVAYALFGAAALHPSANRPGRERRKATRPSNLQLTLLTAASLIAPLLLIFQVLRHQVTDGLAIGVGCLALILLVITRMMQLLRQLERQTARIRELSHTDELTGLPNRRAWNTELPRAMEQARRKGVPLSVAMIDLDRFKVFNDTYGHPAGDRLLKAAGAAWQEKLRAADYLARYGGEEFLVLLPDSDVVLSRQVIERLRDGTPLGQTFSAGVAMWDGTETSDELVDRADAALYAAKQDGRNRIVLAEPDARTPARSLIIS